MEIRKRNINDVVSVQNRSVVHPVYMDELNNLIDEVNAGLDAFEVPTVSTDTISESTSGSGVTIDGVLLKDNNISSDGITTKTGALAAAPLIYGVKPANWFVLFDDFVGTPYDEYYTIVSDAVGGTGLQDDTGGWLLVSATNTDNHETYLSTLNEPFIFDTTRKVYFETRLKLTEANTDDANWIIGLSDTVAANSLLDTGGGPMASYDGAVFFKVDGTMKIQFETSNAGDQVTNATFANFVSGTVYTLGFLYTPGATTASVTPYINGVAGTPHAITVSGLAGMHLLIGMKNGDTNAETLQVDYIYVAQER